MAGRRILVVEDDAAIRRGIVDALQFEGYKTFEADNAKDGREMGVKVDCDLLLLDLILPKGDGFQILEQVRDARPTLPVIILTARSRESDRVKGLKMGADDYVLKPFSVKELLARVEAVLRRSAERPTDVKTLTIPGGTVDLGRCEVRFADGSRTELSEREMELLRYLARHAGRAVTREEILSRVWRINPRAIVETRTIDMHVTRLREKLRDKSPHRVVLTVRGKGYMLAGGGAES